VNRWRKKAEDRSVWAIILKVTLVKLSGPYAEEDEEEEEELLCVSFVLYLVSNSMSG
jgi:hypothetical protein